MDIVTREEWGASAPKSHRGMASTRDRVFVHWLGPAYSEHMTDEQILQSVQRFHQGTRGWSDIAYSLAIGRSARIFELRGPNVAGGHTKGENSDSYGIVFLIGEGEVATPEMLDALTDAIEYLRANDSKLGSPEDVVVVGHRHDNEASTACPGDQLAEFAYAYNHARALLDVQPEEVPNMDNEQQIEKLYNDILGRPSDPEGLKYWIEQVENGTPLGVISHEFLTVRLAADRAALQALATKVDQPAGGGVSSEAIAEEAYQRFIGDLLALQG